MNNTLLKGLAVLELLSHSRTPLTLSQISAELHIVKSNVHRLLQALMETHYVVRHEDGNGYSASIKLWEIGSAVLEKLDIKRYAESHMEQLLEATGESVHLSVLDHTEVVYVHKLESYKPVRAYTQIGGRVPAYAVATGKAQLAHARQDLLERVSRSLQAFTPNTIVQPEVFLREMKRIRQSGIAVNRGEWREDVWGIAAPIFGAHCSLIAAIGISGPGERFRRARKAPWIAMVKAAAEGVSQSLGCSPKISAIHVLSGQRPPLR